MSLSDLSMSRGSLSGEGSLSRGLCPGWVSVQGVSCPVTSSVQGVSVREDPLPSTVTCGQYASHWNAFLF